MNRFSFYRLDNGRYVARHNGSDQTTWVGSEQEYWRQEYVPDFEDLEDELKVTELPANLQEVPEFYLNCVYCEARFLETDDRLESYLPESEAQWQREAAQHKADCEWIQTRAQMQE
jgi:hypothetical protein